MKKNYDQLMKELKEAVGKAIKEGKFTKEPNTKQLYVSNEGDITFVVSRFDEHHRGILDQCQDLGSQITGLKLTRNVVIRRAVQMYFDHIVDMVFKGANVKDKAEILKFIRTIGLERDNCKVAAGR